ncbi:EamA family transporter [Vibrio cholerae]|nr:EamA family transporter [Vibrio cholerae]
MSSRRSSTRDARTESNSARSPTVAAGQIGAGAFIMTVLSPFIGRDPIDLSPAVIISMILLGMVGTGIAYIWYNNVMTAWGATTASTVTYLTPLTGVILGVILVVPAVLVSHGRIRPPRVGGHDDAQ